MYTLDHIYHHSRGLHPMIDVRSGVMIDVSPWVVLSPADKAAGYNMLDVVGANVWRMNGYSRHLKISELRLDTKLEIFIFKEL